MMRTRYRCVSQLAMLLMLVSAGGSASGHQDFVIDLQRDGTLRGLPPRYEPARLSIPNGEYHAGHNVILQLGGNRVEFPECLSILFTKASRKHIQLSPSWYHDPSIVPYYLSIELPTRARTGARVDGCSRAVAVSSLSLVVSNGLPAPSDRESW